MIRENAAQESGQEFDGEGYWVQGQGMKRFQTSPGTPAWQRALALGAMQSRN